MPSTGILGHCDFGGVDNTIDTSMGIVTAGSLDWDSALEHIEGVGGQDEIQGGMVEAGGSITSLINVSHDPLFSSCLRSAVTSSALTEFAVQGGDVSSIGHKLSDCSANTLEINGSVGNAWNFTLDFRALTYAFVASPTRQSSLTASSMQWHNGTFQMASADYICQTCSITIDNGLTPYSALDTRAAPKRYPDGFLLGSEAVTASLTFLTYPGSTNWTRFDEDWLHDTTDDIGVILTAVDAEGSPNTLTVTLANMVFASQAIPFVVGGEPIGYTVELEGQRNQADTVTIAFTA